MNLEITLSQLNTYLVSPVSCMILLIAGIILSIRLRFFQFSNPVKLWKLMNERKRGGTSPFRALTVALAGTLGVGNISGVAIAIALGGSGAVFWMWISAGCAMIVKYAEIVLAVYHRDESKGEIHGGAMYYIKYGLKKHGFSSVLAGCFAAFCLFSSLSTGSVIQVSAVAEAFYGCFSVPPKIAGIIMAILCAVALFSKKKNIISDITVKLVPIMSLIFITLSVVIIFSNLSIIPYILVTIVEDAFTPSSAVGGLGGFIFSRSIRFGVTKGLFSNEAGSGSAPCAAAAADVSHPAKSGLFQALGVLIDTIVICTCTAMLMLLVPEEMLSGLSGMALLQTAMNHHFGQIGVIFIAIALWLFSFSTFLGILYYARPNVAFLFGDNMKWQTAYKVLALVMLFIGGLAKYTFVWDLGDIGVGLMTIFNIIIILPMGGEALKALKEYAEMNK